MIFSATAFHWIDPKVGYPKAYNLFDRPVSRIYKWEDEYTTERYLKLINSFSDFHDLDNVKKKAILETVADYINSNNGKIVVPQEVRLYMANK